jgi:hypothetical protein
MVETALALLKVEVVRVRGSGRSLETGKSASPGRVCRLHDRSRAPNQLLAWNAPVSSIESGREARSLMRLAITSWICLCAIGAVTALQPATVSAAQTHGEPTTAAPLPVVRSGSEGQSDFNFVIGTWKTRILHLGHGRGGTDRWAVWTGRVTAAKVWDGRANIQQIEINAPSGTVEELRLCLYHPLSHEWYLYWADSSDGVLDKPMIGKFKNGVGRFYDQEEIGGREIFVRDLYSDVRVGSYHWQQAFSSDGGATWEPNWRVTLTLEPDGSASPLPWKAALGAAVSHDFDFTFGIWSTRISYLADPSSASNHWVSIRGRATVRKLWGGRANLEEIEGHGPEGTFEGLTLRLYDPRSHQWMLHWAKSDDGVLDGPLVGGFKDGRGTFYNQDAYAGRTVFVRNVYFDIKPDSYRVAQSLSDDGGKTWRMSFTALLTRAAD